MINVVTRERLLDARPVSVDLFSGVGGLALGLELAGFVSAVHVEIEEQARRYAAYNFPLATHLTGAEADVRNLSGAALVGMVGGRDIALISGGPPCQGFSRIGRQRVDDPLNDLVLEMARIILEAEPQAFLIENVPGSLDGKYWQFDKAIEMLGAVYDVHPSTTLKAEDFGVPQRRRRVFTVGFRRDLRIAFSGFSPTHVAPGSGLTLFDLPRTPTVGESILDIPDCDVHHHLLDGDTAPYDSEPHSQFSRQMRRSDQLATDRGYEVDWDQDMCTNLRRTVHGPELLAGLVALAPGEVERKSRIPKLDPDGLSVTIRAGTTSARGSWSAPRPCHPYLPRVLTTRECARIQTFPDWFRFHPVKWHGNRQVGNAVPPLLGKAVGEAIRNALGYQKHRGLLGVVERDASLISADLVSAETAGNGSRRTSHKVVNTGASRRSSRSE